jgi:hypothetical protein
VLGFTPTFGQSRGATKKVDEDIVMLFNNIIELKSGKTSTPNFISLVEDQTLDGRLVTIITIKALMEKNGG